MKVIFLRFYVLYLKPEPGAEFFLMMQWLFVAATLNTTLFAIFFLVGYWFESKVFLATIICLMPILAAFNFKVLLHYYIPSQMNAVGRLSALSRYRLKRAFKIQKQSQIPFSLLCGFASATLFYMMRHCY